MDAGSGKGLLPGVTGLATRWGRTLQIHAMAAVSSGNAVTGQGRPLQFPFSTVFVDNFVDKGAVTPLMRVHVYRSTNRSNFIHFIEI